MEAGYRAVAVLEAKAGQERALLDFTLRTIGKIREVDGLMKVEVNRDVTVAGRLVLDYWWVSPERSERYVAGPLFESFAAELLSPVETHTLYVLENLD